MLIKGAFTHGSFVFLRSFTCLSSDCIMCLRRGDCCVQGYVQLVYEVILVGLNIIYVCESFTSYCEMFLILNI